MFSATKTSVTVKAAWWADALIRVGGACSRSACHLGNGRPDQSTVGLLAQLRLEKATRAGCQLPTQAAGHSPWLSVTGDPFVAFALGHSDATNHLILCEHLLLGDSVAQPPPSPGPTPPLQAGLLLVDKKKACVSVGDPEALYAVKSLSHRCLVKAFLNQYQFLHKCPLHSLLTGTAKMTWKSSG